MTDSPVNVVQATLYGGSAGPHGRRITLRGVLPEQWPEYICTSSRDPGLLDQHFVHVAARVYEHRGPCIEFPDHLIATERRCPDCGSKILGTQGEGLVHRHREE